MKGLLSKEEQYCYLKGKEGTEVKFSYPEKHNELMRLNPKTGKYVLKGTLKHRYVVDVRDSDLVVYWYVMDLIEFEGEPEHWLRLTYYRYLNKEMKWIFAGQTSLSGRLSYFQRFFVGAIKQKENEWTRSFFRDIQRKCSNELDM
jgi:hypothetical protein